MLSEDRLAELMAYCRIDDLGPGEEALLERCYLGALSYLEEAGVSEPEKGTPRRAQYDLCVCSMVLDAWDNRGASSEARSGHTMTENRAFRYTLNQLKLTEPPMEGA